MAAENSETPPELAAALEDLRQIRETVDRSRANHPVRLVGRALMTLSVVVGLTITVFGIAAQLVLDHLDGGLFGLSQVTLVWGLGGLLVVVNGLSKVLVMAAGSRRAGFDLNLLVGSMVTNDYARILAPILLLAAAAAIGLVWCGHPGVLVGLLTLATGASYIALPVVIPLAEMTWLGIVYVVLGGLAMFVFPELPFFKLAAVLGLPMVVGGLIGRRVFPEERSS